MSQLAPLGAGLPGRHPVGQPGGHRLRPGHAASEMQKPGFYEALSAPHTSLVDGLTEARPKAPASRSVGDCQGGMFGFFFMARAAAELRHAS